MSPTSRRRVAVACILGTTIVLPIAWSLRPASSSGHAKIAAGGSGLARENSLAALPLPKAPAKAPAAEVVAPVSEIIGSQWQASSHAQLVAFSGWSARYLAAPVAERGSLLAEGIAAAAARREVLATMIRENPEQALASAVPVMVRAQLPAEVVALLEDRVSGKGSVELLAATPMPGQTRVPNPYSRHALVNGKEYEAFTYGRREKINYLPDISIVGIAVDGALALSDSPLRVLEKGELPDGRAVEEVCPVSGITTPVAGGAALNTHVTTAVEVNGGIEVVCEPAHVATVEKRLISGEGSLLANGAPGSSEVTGRPDQAWTHGSKKVLIIRVDFSDVPGTPQNSFTNLQVTPQVAVNAFNDPNGIRDFYEQTSYNKTTLSIAPVVSGASPDVTPVLRMPSSAASYVTVGAVGVGNASQLHSDAQALATTAGYNVTSYDRIGVVYSNLGNLPGSRMTFGGLGSTPGKNFWINGAYVFGVVAHEIGHNYGLNHSSTWEVTDGNPVSPTGSKQEYGDLTDVMGDGSDITHQFNHWNKSIAQWMPDAAVTTINSGGTYRVYRFDHPSSNLANALALKVVRNRTQDYWIGYRRATTRENFNNGAYVVWGANENTNGLLLDLNTPGNTMDDAPLGVGQTFNDTAAGITLTTVARGGSGINEYLDVQVGFLPRLAWTQSAYPVDEQSGTATLTLSRSNNSTGAVSVNWATTPGTATAPADFTTSSGTVSWANGDAADKTVVIPIAPDSTPEGTHSFTVALSSPSGGVIVDDPATTVDIVESGSNDPSFTATFINSTILKTLALPDGKVLIAGYFSEVGSGTRMGIARLTADGAEDTTFATGGTNAGGFITDMVRQPDGKIIVVGNFNTMMGVGRSRIARLNEDGTLDTSFAPGAGPNTSLSSVLVQPDGKILIGGGFTSYSGTPSEYVARLNANGTLDSSFTGPDFGGFGGWGVSALALQPDGKLLIGGVFYFLGGSSFKSGLCRVTTTGALDPAFTGVTDGASEEGDTSTLMPISTVAVQLDGKILIGGQFTAFNNQARGGFARLTSTGAVDTGFAADTDGTCQTILIQPDGKIVVGGTFAEVDGVAINNLVRLSSSGDVDNAFSGAGGPDNTVYSLAMQANGKIVFAGNLINFQGLEEFFIYRVFGGLPGLPGTLQFSSPALAVTEGSSALVTVSRTGGSSGAMSVNFSTVAGGAGLADFTATQGTLSWGNGDSATKTITIPITTDALAETGETFTVNIGQPLMGGAILGAAQTATVSISDPGAGGAYQTWRSAKFTALELTSTSISGDNADPDKDGIVNLLEFAFGLEPKTASQTGTPSGVVQNIGGNNYLTLTFRRQISAPELTYTPQANGQLAGTWLGNAVLVGAPASNGDGTETVTYRSSTPITSSTKGFMRLQVILQE